MSGISVIAGGSTNLHAKGISRGQELEDESEDEDPPLLLDPSLPSLGAAIDQADVIIEVLDGRDPQAYRNLELERHVQKLGKRLLLLINKIGRLCPELFEMLSANIYSRSRT
jgi:nuclear GTP-binding protein